MNLLNLSEREKRLALVTGIIFVFFVLLTGWHVISNQLSQSTLSEATVVRFDDLFAKINNVETQKSRNLLLRKKIGNEKGIFIDEKDVIQLIAEIEQVAGRCGVQIKNWDPNVDRRSKPLPRLDVKISLECKFEQFIKFLDQIRSAKYLCQLSSLRTKLKDPKKPDLEVSMTLTTYLLNAKPAQVSPSRNVAQR